MKKNKAVIMIGVLIFAGLFLYGIFSGGHKRVPRVSIHGLQEKPVVRVMQAAKKDLKFILSYVGSLKAQDEAAVFSKASGKLQEYTVKEGDRIEKGQIIALADRDETGLKYEPVKIESPISGIVGRTLLDKGASITAQETAVAIVLNMGQMRVKLNTTEQDTPYLRMGLKAQIQVDAYPDEIFSGEVSRVAQVLDSQTRTLPIEITIPNEDLRLKSGMFARIKIIAAYKKDVLALTQDAVVRELGVNYVFTVEGGLARKKKISLGIQEDGNIEILDGIRENDTVIVFGQQGLKDETPVEIAKE